MRAALASLIGVLLVGPFQITAPAATVNPYAHVRAMQTAADDIVAEGMARSATFRRLVNRLEQSDVIVYVDIRPDMPPNIGGSLRFLAMSATTRFLRVQLNRADSRLWLVALLGHELQHAVEVADARDVQSASDLKDLYLRIGVATGPNAFDSMAARQAGYTVRDEVSAAHDAGWRLARTHVDPDPVAPGESLGDDGAAPSSVTPAAMPIGDAIGVRP